MIEDAVDYLTRSKGYWGSAYLNIVWAWRDSEQDSANEKRRDCWASGRHVLGPQKIKIASAPVPVVLRKVAGIKQ
jgi:hypothetical protein